ncbi:MAG: bi-domain-containing oxidoreductase, partial [Acidobacteriota bacterium]|nr:bi-domain-containing oxidoreductase [Acidobacteriota bacterium]
MKQVLQNRKTGKVAVVEVPVPALQRGRVLVRTVASLISSGTERAAVAQARKSLLQEARERPDLVRSVFDRARTDGLLQTFGAVRDKLAASQALGYSASGIVIGIGQEVTKFRVGDRVACAGLGFASHAEAISVPRNLCVHLPENVDFEAGAFGTLGAIALQGVRLAEPTLGESVVVIGLGLVGQLTAQLLKANGCRVFGIDLDQSRINLARELGAEGSWLASDEPAQAVNNWTYGRGADAVLMTAGSDSNQPIELAGEISRVKGRVVVVGSTGLQIPRQTFYNRELALKISMSYGPGRYDPEYEERGHDYPFGYVRWTEQRNIEAFLQLISEGRVNVERLVTHRFPIAEAERAYEVIDGSLPEPHLGVLLEYDSESEPAREIELGGNSISARKQEKNVRVGLIGAGDYLRAMLLPQFQSAGAEFHSIATASGVSAHDVGNKFGFARAVSDADAVINDPKVNLLVIGTRHDLHAELARRALERGLHVFVEKPLALCDEDLNRLLEVAANAYGRLVVGFNRRFSPLAVKAKDFFGGRRAPLSFVYRINAGRAPKGHWTNDPRAGGGRIVGEVCHFIDLLQYWTEAPPVSVFAEAIASASQEIVNDDSVLITVRFADGSTGCIAYLAEGDKTLPKERVEIFGEGKVFVLDDFRSALLYRGGREEELKLRKPDKGQAEEVKAVCRMVLEDGPAPISLAELATTTRATFRILDSLRSGQPEGISAK